MSDMLNFAPNEEQLRLAYWHHIHGKGVNLDRRDVDAEFTRGIERIKAQVRAEAWDEGAGDMAEHIDNGAWWEIQNPYRDEQS